MLNWCVACLTNKHFGSDRSWLTQLTMFVGEGKWFNLYQACSSLSVNFEPQINAQQL